MIDAELQNRVEAFLAPYREFSPVELATHLGIEIAYVDFTDPNFSGAIRRENNVITLYINKNQSENRQLFTIAHELGHFFLHAADMQRGIVSYRHGAMYENYSPEEKKREEEANHFAAEILMPRQLFTDFYYKNRSKDRAKLISEIAKEFGVSEDAVKVRLSYLDL